MTREEARDLLAMIKVKEPGEFIVNSWWGSFVNDYKEALQMAIEALEQEPCEDCISREIVKQLYYKDGYIEFSKICNLPSVTPKEKTGRWISFGIQGEIDGQIVKVFACSECGAISIFRVSNGNIVNGDLCPNCGAKMQEVEE